VKRAKAGKLAWIGGGNSVDVTYVDNAAHAHLQALDALSGKDAKPAGKAYFISQGTPVQPDAWVGEILAAIGVPPVTRRVKLPLAYAVGAVMEATWSLFGLKGEPPMTRFVAAQLGTSHHYDLSAARRDFGYSLLIDDTEAMRRTITWIQDEQLHGRM
jgi:nucleoside-diphosphate-sugar epimerase